MDHALRRDNSSNMELRENDNIEVECIINPGKVSKHGFNNVIQYCRSVLPLSNFKTIDVLSINFAYKNNSYRIDISGIHNISKYCKTNSLVEISPQNVTIISKKPVVNMPPVLLTDYDIKVNIKEEKNIDDEQIIKDLHKHLGNIPKYFRLKKRFSFTTTDDPFRYDLTIVKSSKVTSTSFVMSQTARSQEQYEVEIEMENTKVIKSKKPSKTIVEQMLSLCANTLCAMREEDYILGATERKDVRKEYDKLCGFKQDMPSYKAFIGPMPITLEKKNLIHNDPSSILTDYTVTDKADGERRLLYFTPKGYAYLIDRNMEITKTGIHQIEVANTIVDGEYITRSIADTRIKEYAIFDVYYFKGQPVFQYPLITTEEKKEEDSRMNFMKKMAETKFHGDTDGEDGFKLNVKEFDFKNILVDCANILKKKEQGRYRYKIDGLIFTPKSLCVGGVYTDECKPKLGGTWIKTFKWKPPEDNSIDFMVKVQKHENGKDMIVVREDGREYKVFNLFVAYDLISSEKLTVDKFSNLYHNFLKQKGQNNQSQVNTRQLRLFDPGVEDSQYSFIPLNDQKVSICQNRDVVFDGAIVEFTYNNDEWKALRVRKDKTMPNAYNVAMNVWNSMTDEVTTEMITGKSEVKVDSVAPDEDVYYNRIAEREQSSSKPMLSFHNYWVKDRSLIGKLKGKSTSVLDMACGKGNDLYKLLNNGFKVIVGVDKSEDNITNNKDGAYNRVLNCLTQNTLIGREHNIMYLPIDCSKLIDIQFIDKLSDEKVKQKAKDLWLNKDGLLNKGVDVVLCNFAIHYFFENKTTLSNFIKNVSNALRRGGYFVGTCLDGKTVHELFEEQKQDKVEGRVNQTRPIWSLEKAYGEKVFDTKNTQNNYGLKIKVYIETINREMEEYLVDYELLKTELAAEGIYPLTEKESAELKISGSSSTFKKLYETMERHGNPNNKSVQEALKMTHEQKQYSFMNRWFIFRKR
jgi:SAM-dependent methyltransferase